MRLFTGLDLPDGVLTRVDAVIQGLKPGANVQWSRASNLHITTKFIGEWPESRLDELNLALQAVPKPGPLEIGVRGLGWFPNPHHPRIFWAGIHAPAALHDLARTTNESTAAIGVPVEEKPYSPHLTLARIKNQESVPGLRQAVARLDSADFGTFEATSFFLYRSEPGSNGSIYTKLAEFPLAS